MFIYNQHHMWLQHVHLNSLHLASFLMDGDELDPVAWHQLFVALNAHNLRPVNIGIAAAVIQLDPPVLASERDHSAGHCIIRTNGLEHLRLRSSLGFSVDIPAAVVSGSFVQLPFFSDWISFRDKESKRLQIGCSVSLGQALTQNKLGTYHLVW